MKLKKLALITSSLLLGSSMAYAADAVLNVEGEIQINGKTVINSAGEFVGKINVANLSANVVQLSAYEPQPGIYTYEGGYYGDTVRTITENSWEDVTTSTYGSISHKSEIEGNTITTTWSENGGDDYSESGSTVETFENLSSAPDNYIIGTLASEVTRYTLVSSSNEYDDEYDAVGDDRINGYPISYTALLPSYTVNGKTYQECLFAEDDPLTGHSGDGFDPLIVCSGIGEVQSDLYGKLVSYEPAGSSRSMGNSSAANQALKIRVNALRQLMAKKAENRK